VNVRDRRRFLDFFGLVQKTRSELFGFFFRLIYNRLLILGTQKSGNIPLLHHELRWQLATQRGAVSEMCVRPFPITECRYTDNRMHYGHAFTHIVVRQTPRMTQCLALKFAFSDLSGTSKT
jgi:hypothetical protein